jgi:hypothetical protein
MTYKLQDLQEDVENLAYRLKNGCGNHGCVIKEPNIGTNGGWMGNFGRHGNNESL